MACEPSGRELFAFGLGVLATLGWLNNGVAQARFVPSGSMAPTFAVGDRILVTPYHPSVAQVERGDVLVFHPPLRFMDGIATDAPWYQSFLTVTHEPQPYLKRCVGLPGETVAIVKGVGVLIEGKLISEPYILEKPRYDWGPQQVPSGKLFVLGDNRNDSFDSHYWGFLPIANVIGRPSALIWPPRRWRGF